MENNKDICKYCGKHWTEECTTPFSIFNDSQEITALTGNSEVKK